MLTEAELRGLATLSETGECTVTEFADALGRSRSYTSELLTDLAEAGLVVTTTAGREKRIRLADTRAAETFERLRRRHSHVDLAELLGGATMRLVYFLDEPRSASTLASRAGVHRSTVYRSLQPLVDRGIVREDDSEYVLTDSFSDFATFARELAHHVHRRRFDERIGGFVILWETLDESLAETDEAVDADDFHETGPRLFREYDLPLFVREQHHYWYAPDADGVSPVDLCCHQLCIDDGSRSKSYCLLLLAHADVDAGELRDRATKYGVEDAVEELLTYLDTRGESRPADLPRWDEFERLAADYDVTVDTGVTG